MANLWIRTPATPQRGPPSAPPMTTVQARNWLRGPPVALKGRKDFARPGLELGGLVVMVQLSLSRYLLASRDVATSLRSFCSWATLVEYVATGLHTAAKLAECHQRHRSVTKSNKSVGTLLHSLHQALTAHSRRLFKGVRQKNT